ncbi:MAG TPA: SDR family oxidoreductase [Pyrinomonadaceae bacterium]|nr:SDR family oxidoreductase [Pyrinomonadaceae bacterium]
MSSGDTFFITGFPGFIASRLLALLAGTDSDFILLVQPTLALRARKELEEIASASGRSIADFQVIEGDIGEPNLGLTNSHLDSLRSRATRVFHLAAVYDLAVPQDVAMHVNVGGTHNVRELVRTFPRLRQFHHVSTCYVAGKREGQILETELQHEAGFRNFYEESKYLSEMELESLKGEVPITIHRPSVVCGDSRTGQTGKYDGVYYLIHYLLKWPSVLSQLNIGNHEVSLNLVPVDFVVSALARLAYDEAAIGKTVQLADPRPLTTNQLFNAITGSINGAHSKITVPRSWVYFLLMLPPSPRITGLPHHAVPYFFVKQIYDSSQAQALLAPKGIICPPFVSYVDKIIDFAARNPVVGQTG